MAIRVALHHRTHYQYDRLVTLQPHVVRLRPAPHCRTPIVSYALRVRPGEHFLNWQQDPFSNHQARLAFPSPTRELSVEVDLVADLVVINPFDFFLDPGAEEHPVLYEDALRVELAPYFETLPPGPALRALIAAVDGRIVRPGRRTVDVLVELNQEVQRRLRYDVRVEPGVFTPEETLSRGHGSCRDFTWLLVQLLRHVGFATRFVSGYSIQLVTDERALDGPTGVAVDVTDLHAWAEVYLPGGGWIGLDPTSGMLAVRTTMPSSSSTRWSGVRIPTSAIR